jgi:hypothetical protein
MKVSISSYKENKEWNTHPDSDEIIPEKASLVMGFGAKGMLETDYIYTCLKEKYTTADIVLCSTSGEIYNNAVLDNTVSVTAIQFEKTNIQTAVVNIEDYPNSFDAGKALVETFILNDELAYILVLSDGGKVNGSELVKGINQYVQHKVPVTGGLAGDGARFISTLVGLNAQPASGKIVAIAFYSSHLSVQHGSMGGWEMFGPERTVTKSTSNEVFEINGESALDLYTKYLGTYATDLPGSALLFPLSVKLDNTGDPIVRTILSINPETQSMVFAGDVPQGSQVRFMKANFDKVIFAAGDAARQTIEQLKVAEPKLALLISCVGRKLVLSSRIEEEVEAVREIFGPQTLLSGFYSYGEISPFSPNTKCELHNQTMTITTFNEN